MRIPTLCSAACAIAIALFIVACGSKLTDENISRVKEGMSEQEVAAILGPPTDTSKVEILGISGTSSIWKDSNATVAIQFVNGKALLKSYATRSAK